MPAYPNFPAFPPILPFPPPSPSEFAAERPVLTRREERVHLGQRGTVFSLARSSGLVVEQRDRQCHGPDG
jgi:hypothetical protein